MPINTNTTFIIAEAGVNHNGSLETAMKMVEVAVEAGVDAVKFQSFKAENLAVQDAPKAEYQQQTTGNDGTQFEMLKRLELSPATHTELFTYCRQKKIQFLSSPFDLDSVDLLYDLGIKIFKIPSGEITNLPLLKKIGRLGKPVILSTGMSDLKEIEEALDVLVNAGTRKEDVTVLQCNTDYPTSMDDVNLRAMITIKDAFPGIQSGYSDHTLGIEIPIAAVALGATVIEKHFTLDRNLPGPDHRASLEPDELTAMVKAIRNIQKAMGDGIKQPSPSEIKNIPIARKSIVAKKSIRKGKLLTEDNLTVKRPGTGISPMKWDEVISTRAKKDYQADELI